MRITVIGCGYLGAVHAACMAELGHEVLGIDVDQAKVDALAAGRAPFFEPGLPELLRSASATGRLRFTTDMSQAADYDAHFIAVGTPQKKGEFAADLSYVDAAVTSLVPHLKPGALVIGKSTVPVGTARRLAGIVEAGAPDAGLAWNPEFLREGFAVEDTLRPDRLVYGVPEGEAGERAKAVLDEIYAVALSNGTPLVVTGYETAELVKVSANAFLATKISFINAIAEVADVTGADVTKIADAIGYDDRIGRKFLNAGLGFGGGCLPKDIRAFQARAGELGADQALTFLREVDEINQRRRVRAVDLTREILDGTLRGKKVAVLGLAFKPNSDDIRDSPALDVAVQLRAQGARVIAYDPEAIVNAKRQHPELDYASSVEEAATDADAVVVLTEWKQFRELDPAAFGELVGAKNILDGRNCLDPEAWRAAGWQYRALGRP
ncbi:UDP-glucose dehydrogenase family protein [Gryllotalpicola ginsengisoli]|uniref:UDP-glucose dehydrogenase family protein n=1 Tax=Gryllotalpicola ginsengisoli TaxID=444608 RepID=UPI0003B67D41|nr:UDP-glucose/GDP-mannose dehydrogenase family protein [Gryllotalpicola ginsengisoli]